MIEQSKKLEKTLAGMKDYIKITDQNFGTKMLPKYDKAVKEFGSLNNSLEALDKEFEKEV